MEPSGTLEPFERIYATYPTLYYLSVFADRAADHGMAVAHALSELVLIPVRDRRVGGPAVDRGLRGAPAHDGASIAGGWIVAMAVLNPMVVFLSSG